MLKKVLLIVSLLVTVSAQDGQNVGWITKFGLAGGFNPIWISPNVDAVNKMLPQFGTDKLSTTGMIGYGGSGYIYILLVENVRIGGMGFGLTQTREGTVNGYNRQADYSIGMGGVTIEYTIPFLKTPAISVGAIIGAGSVKIDLYQSKNSFEWDDVWTNFESDPSTKMNTIENTFFTITPTLNIDYPVTRYLAFRLGTGYLISIGDSWELNNNLELNNVPTDLNANSFFVQAGIYLGFFAF